MNRNRYRLVFNTTLGMMVPVAETARRRGKACGGKAAGPALALLLAAFPALAQTLPVPCGGGACGLNPNPTAFVGSGAAGYAVNGTQGIVTQTTNRAILNWQSFNVGSGNTMQFVQPSAGAATLNRIWQGDASVIAGALKANGQLYLVNQNGIVFANGAQVNAGRIVASTLDIDDKLFIDGIPSNRNAGGVAAFSAASGAAGGLVQVEAGATLKTESGGLVMLLAENVENHGLIETPEGQTILAAGAKVYLAVSDDPNLRGFLVEVDSPDSGGGTATNTGRVLAERGNVSMTGLTVNQSGRVTATTSVNLNGSIRLTARDSVSGLPKDSSNPEVTVPVAARTGTLVLGANSTTEVLADATDRKTLTDEQVFNRSRIDGVGKTIHVQGGAVVRATSGEIDLAAQAGSVFQNAGDAKVNDVRLQVDHGALIDTAGLANVAVAVERNYIEVELRGSQLADSPLQRNTFLNKSKVWIDAEKGTQLADVSADIARLERSVAEKSAVGGNIALRSEGDMVLQAGATLDVSGGSLAYQAGYGRVTKLALNGQVVDIGDADPEQVYSGFADRFTAYDAKWNETRTFDVGQARYINAYTAGRDAGTLSLTAHNLVADATLLGKTTTGTYQRTQAPQGGQLALTLLANSALPVASLPDFSFVKSRIGAAATGFSDALPAQVELSSEFLSQGGFAGVAVRSKGRIMLPSDVTLDAGDQGRVSLSGRRIDIDGDILAAGGEIALATGVSQERETPDATDFGLNIGSTARLDVAGRWVNDLPGSGPDANTGSVVIDGGVITLAAHSDLTLAEGSVLDVSGGAWVKSNGRISTGDAGSIDLASGSFGQQGSAPLSSRIELGGELRGYGVENGGTLKITASSIHMGENPAGTPGELVLDEGFFGRGGFREFDLSGVDGVNVADGFQLRPAPLSAQLAPGYSIKASGSDMTALTTLLALPAEQRAPTRVSLTASNFFRGDVHVGEGASIRVDPEGEVVLSANRQLTVLGTLEAAAGHIALTQPVLTDGDKAVDNFDPGRSIFLGENSRLLATGYYRAEPNPHNLRKGQVLDGGSVDITAAKGYLIAQQGSLIDVSGTETTLDIVGASGLAATPVASNGGTITLAAREGMILEGDLHGRAGGSQARGGSLAVALDRMGPSWVIHNPADPLNVPLNSQRVVTLQAAPTSLAAGMNAGDALDTASRNGQARLTQSQVQDGGFADLSLQAENRIAFADTLDLNLDGRLSLFAPNLSAEGTAQVRLAAASAIVGNPGINAQAEGTRNDASGGAGTLTVNAGLIELVGHSSLQGFGETTLASRGDIRTRGVVYDADPGPTIEEVEYVYRGSLVTGGDLNLAARQIYPASLAEYAFEVHNNPAGRITVTSTGSDGKVLSAGGKLSFAAPFIEQRGAIKAPFGEIALRAETITRVTNAFNIDGLPTGATPVTLTRAATPNGEVTLADGSLTSVSAQGQIIPLGMTELSGRDWIYDFGTFKKQLASAPEKQIVLDGDTVAQAAGARIDLSGGGDVYAYEFFKGPGGSRDMLLPENSEGVYAVLPGLDNAFAAYDHQIYRGLENWNPGASVQLLDSTQGLAAGNYALLPARYALLPGAYLVRVRTQASDQVQGQVITLPNGATRVAGYLGTATANGDVLHGARTATLEIRPGSVAREYSEYLNSYASQRFAQVAGAQLPGDAGRLSIGVGSSLTLLGDLLAGHADGRRGAEVDISADKLAVTSSGASYGAGYVTLSVDQLDSLNASSLLLGGSRSAAGDRVQLTQRSDEVVIANDADHALTAPEVILAARDTVKLEDGAVVAGDGAFSGQARDLVVVDSSGNGDGALLRVSTGDQIALTRESSNRTGGVLDVAAGATVRGKSVVLDATLDNRTLGQVELPASGGALALGATRISLAENGTAVATSGLVFNQNRLADLGNPAQLLLRSYSTLDIYGNVNLGSSALDSLAIEAAGITGIGAAGQTATLQADTVRFANPDSIDAATAFAATPGAGDLAVLARNVELGEGDFTLRGFDSVNVTASGQVQGLGGSFKTEASAGAAGDLNLDASRITVAAGADQTLSAAGALVTGQPAAPATLPAAALGGKLQLAGASVTHGGRIDMPAGVVELRAESGDVTLLTGSEILAGGASVDFADTQAFAAGGTVNLTAVQGKVTAQAGSNIDVAGAAAGGDAGELTVLANDDAVLGGTLQGDAASGFESGRFALTARRINPDADGDNDFSALNSTLEAGGFHAARSIRVREGDIDVAATDNVKAHEVLLSADTGAIRVAGTVDASGGKGGRIGLYADGNLDLLSSAKLLANATDSLTTAKGTAGEGGRVELGSGDTGVLNLAAGSSIDVSVPAGSAARGGRVVLRAARTGTGAGDGVALGARDGKIVGAERVEVEAYKVYDGDGSGITELVAGSSSGNQLGLATVQADNDAFVAAVDAVALKGNLDTGAAGVHLRPGVEVRNPVEAGVANSGDIALAGDWNLNPLRHNGEAGVLTVRAGGQLDVAANLSDGFSTATASGALQTSPIGWSYRLVAGAASGAADPLATQPDVLADLNVAAGKLVRSGTGDIDAVAAGDVILADGAALYTAGANTPAVTDFTLTGLSGTAFPVGGGDVRIRAGGAVVSETGPSGLLTDWLYRQGNINSGSSVSFRDPGWWPQIAQFKNGIAALGGGDVALEAAGRVANLLVATVTNARQPATFAQPVDASRQVIQGGGDLAVRAGGDIEGGLFFVDRGAGTIRTGGAVVDGLTRSNQAVGTVLALGDARTNLSARRGVSLEAVINPSLVPQVSGNLAGVGGFNRESYFVSYGADSAARLLSVAGDTVLKNDFSDLTGLSGAFGLNSGNAGGLGLYPGTLEAVALMGKLVMEEGFTLMPAAAGNLRLLAGSSVEKYGGKPVDLSDRALTDFYTLDNPVRSSSSVGSLTILPASESDAHGPELIHQADTQQAYIVARSGDIVGQPSPAVFANLAKPAVFQAGRDIRDVTVVGQNLRPDDVTRFIAGRDIVFDLVRNPISGAIASGSEARIAIGGPGRVEVIAGRDIDLGASKGVISRGNLANPYLPEGGADLLFVAGAAARDADGNPQAISAALQDRQAVNHFFNELLASAEASKTDKDYSQGEAAIEALFPTGTAAAPLSYEGDISLFFSQAKTEQGGNIQMLAPGGGVNAGLASVTGFERAAADLGIMTVQGGNIQAYVRDDFQVNSSRVFSVSGGDILIWSSLGNIDAGKGAKTASATPPPRLRIDSKGNFVLDVSQSISGSGIGALDADSDVVLIAPTGEVNAGDAGIRAGGNLTIGAQRVVGADNIQVGGVTAGVPISNSGAAAAAATSAGNVGSEATSATAGLSQGLADSVRAAEDMKNAFKPTFISAEVVGHGD
jgi:filamentous hemagglutinin family protein